ncbi:hypothetical protein [Devosia sp.]|uniref:hypothetical protein n=1 Tax=Devosia sp. TaxID=1871048 RepID=UPI002AFED600|nr:hypothetical protein [Devosia sp.]
MATLNIGGQRVKVSDDFLRMSPEQQNAAVEEIAASLGGRPDAYDAALADASARSQALQFNPNAPKEAGRPDLMGATAATLGGLVNGIPVLGPMVQNTSDALIGAGSQLMGGNYGETVRGLQERRAQLSEANPVADIAGNLAGGLGAYGGLAKTAGGAAALGLEGSLGARIGNSAASGAAISGADAAFKGGTANDILTNAAYGGGIGAVTPPIASGLGLAARAIGSKVAPTIAGAIRPAEEASRRTGQVFARDMQVNPGGMFNAADEALARQAGIPLMNVDRGGETARALARSVANQNPEARSIITKAADERFESQGLRAIDFIKRLTGGAVDDLGYQKSIREVAKMVNKPRYDAAFNHPQAQNVFTADLQELMQSPAIQRAITMTQGRGKDLAAIDGFVPVQNPFRQGQDGVWRLVQKANGTLAVPNLQFWDQVKRNLDGMIGVAQRGGDNTELSILTQLKNKLVGSLDGAVPQYRTARQGAASFFDAEDALEAGKKFATQPRNVPEARKAFEAFNPTEKQAFQTGYASELIDRIRSTRDRVNVINQVFGSQSSREMAELVFGPTRARQLEAYVRVEGLADAIRGALGNSTTARQLVELGIGTGVGGAAGFGISGGNFGTAIQGAALGAGAAGARALGQRIDAKVMQEVARILTSRDPKDLQKAIYNASMSPTWMEAIRTMEQQLQIGTRAALVPSAGQ